MNQKKLNWNKKYSEREWVWSPEPTTALVETLIDLPAGQALDLGAGEGRNSIWLAAKGWQVTAVDFSSVGIEKGQQIAKKQSLDINWRCHDLEDFTAATDSFSLLIWVYVHIPNSLRQSIWTRLLSSLKPGGHFIYIGHDPANIGRGAGGPQNAEVLASRDDVCSDLQGFQILESKLIERPYGTDPGHGGQTNATALDALVHAIK